MLRLSPPEWLAEGYQAYFLLDLVDELNLFEILIPAQTKDLAARRWYAQGLLEVLLSVSPPLVSSPAALGGRGKSAARMQRIRLHQQPTEFDAIEQLAQSADLAAAVGGVGVLSNRHAEAVRIQAHRGN